MRNVCKIVVGKSELVKMWTAFIWLKRGTSGWFLGNDYFGSVKGWEFNKLTAAFR